jgi:hypothetical protein
MGRFGRAVLRRRSPAVIGGGTLEDVRRMIAA